MPETNTTELRKVICLSDLPEEHLQWIIDHGEVSEFNDGDLIHKTTDPVVELVLVEAAIHAPAVFESLGQRLEVGPGNVRARDDHRVDPDLGVVREVTRGQDDRLPFACPKRSNAASTGKLPFSMIFNQWGACAIHCRTIGGVPCLRSSAYTADGMRT